MAVSADRQVKVVLYRLGRSFAGDRSTQHGAAQPGDDFHVAECGDVEIDVVGTQDVLNRWGGIRTQEVFEQRRRVGDDEPQEASLEARSSWMSSDAGRPRLTCVLAWILSKTSSAGGLPTSRSRSSWM